MAFSKTIQMYIFDGDPNGRIMCELSNWNGRVYKVSRNQIQEFSTRNDADNTGVYFLIGKDENNNDTVYIGEAEKMSARIKQHLKDNEYWNDCIAVISKDDFLNKAHVKYLENKFFNLAQKSGRVTVINNNVPTCSSISEYDEAMLIEFINNARLLVNVLGYKIFDTILDKSVKQNKNLTYDSELYYIKAARGAEAKGSIVSDGFVVFAGSQIASSATPSMSDSLRKLRENLINKNIIDADYKFNKDYVFSSPSLAAATVMGRNANGRTEWKTKSGKSIKDFEDQIIKHT